MKRRHFLGTTAGLAAVGTLSAGSVTASNGGTLVNATTTSSGAIVATDDDFVIAGQHVTIDGGSYYASGGDHYVVYTNGYDGEVRENTFTVQSVLDRTFAIRVDGGTVDVTGNTIDAADDIVRRFVGVGVVGGATVEGRRNEITGAHRVGVVVRGSGTTVDVSRNTIVGPGPRTTGWADNGVQLSDGASGSVRANVVDDHWYAPNSFVSSGLIAFADDVVVQRNHFGNNDLAVGYAGDRNNVIHNDIEVTYPMTTTDHYGVYDLGGTNNGIRQNSITAAGGSSAAIGIIVLGDNTKLIRNRLDGWQTPILDAGDDTKLPKPFDSMA